METGLSDIGNIIFFSSASIIAIGIVNTFKATAKGLRDKKDKDGIR